VEKHKTAMNKLVELYRYFDKHRIYLPTALCASLEKLVMEVRSHVIHFGVYVRYDEKTLNEQTHKEKEKAWNSGWDAIKNQIPLARQSLEDEFRFLLGAAANPTVDPDARKSSARGSP
jgi:hypothetical protein